MALPAFLNPLSPEDSLSRHGVGHLRAFALSGKTEKKESPKMSPEEDLGVTTNKHLQKSLSLVGESSL